MIILSILPNNPHHLRHVHYIIYFRNYPDLISFGYFNINKKAQLFQKDLVLPYRLSIKLFLLEQTFYKNDFLNLSYQKKSMDHPSRSIYESK